MKKTFYVTTPIFYPSNNLHIGHFYTLTIAQVFKSYKQILGYDAIMLTGSDEHGEKIQKVANQKSMKPQEFVNFQWNYFQNFLKKCEFFPDILVRTTSKGHKKTVLQVFKKMSENGDIYKDFYQGLYSINDEEFITKENALKIANKYFHPISKHELEEVSFPSYFFDIGKYTDFIKKFLEDNKLNLFEFTQKELINSFIKKNLKDLSISRNTFDWGIKIAIDKEHVIYVWLDALFSYLSGLGFLQKDDSLYKKYWRDGDEILQIIGKEITRFHCIYWPIFLKSLNLRKPSKILVHGWILSNNEKMSKSKGNVIDPLSLVNDFTPEVIKYYILSRASFSKDISLDMESLKATYNEKIVNIFGNLHSRIISLFHQKNSSFLNLDLTTFSKEEKFFIDKIFSLKETYIELMNENNIYQALKKILRFALDLNSYIELKKPWKLEGKSSKFQFFMLVALNSLFALDIFLLPFLPNSSRHYLNLLGFREVNLDMVGDLEKFIDKRPEKNVIFYKRKK